MDVDLCYLFEKKLPEATFKKYNEIWDEIKPQNEVLNLTKIVKLKGKVNVA